MTGLNSRNCLAIVSRSLSGPKNARKAPLSSSVMPVAPASHRFAISRSRSSSRASTQSENTDRYPCTRFDFPTQYFSFRTSFRIFRPRLRKGFIGEVDPARHFELRQTPIRRLAEGFRIELRSLFTDNDSRGHFAPLLVRGGYYRALEHFRMSRDSLLHFEGGCSHRR